MSFFNKIKQGPGIGTMKLEGSIFLVSDSQEIRCV